MVLKLFLKDRVYSQHERIGEYTLIKVIGEGRYGICYLVSKDGNKFILKQLKNRMVRKVGIDTVFEEQILGSIEHPCIPRLITRISMEEFNGYILEYKEGKTFEEIIYQDKHIFEREEIYSIGLQLIQILRYLHDKRVVHRDIRVPNTLYNEGKICLVDFGLARWVDGDTYTADVDFSFLGDFLLHLFYTSYNMINWNKGPWFEELKLTRGETVLLKRLMGIEKRYASIYEVEHDYLTMIT
jgi:serine/threonine-protein kinase